MSLALLPIGLIAFIQTQQIADQSQRTAELSLIAVTEQAAATERSLLQEALGASRALTSVVKLVRDNPRQCSDFLKSYKEEVSKYRLVGFIDVNGKMDCSSTHQSFDLSESVVFKQAVARSVRTVTAVDQGRVSGAAVVVVTVPLFEDDEAIGFFFISISRDALETREMEDPTRSPLSMITFNDMGEIVTSEQEQGFAELELPEAYPLKQLTGNTRQVFTARNAEGIDRVYAVIPMVEGTVFAMSVWPSDTALLETDFSSRLSSLLPIIMWVASLVVAFWALNRLAIIHISKLGRQMRHFALNRTLPRKPLGEQVPVEIVAMEKSFLGMARSILQDEARLEDSLREKNMLLKEVHHRVKNNLQLISSIMNMQIRQAPTEANKRVLQRLQDRILSLATVHKSLYQDNEMSRVDAGTLLREIVARSLEVGMETNAGIDVIEDYDSILIGPDDAAPLSLLTSEAVTNALKYVPRGQAKNSKIEVSLKLIEPERAQLRIVNTAGGAPPEEGTGLGSRLILAFSRQLNGTLEVSEEDGMYLMSLDFPVPQSDKAIYDY
ncbi:histidine kinase dimerization/phosphoacceptor domain -containing protein [uncultured Sulfitobacter sp.]|uniref:histidine kinase dimerization/phosphoacceptor domain -containing protein n=1 Tax=uncultured Sulfitobacter sp. TaxID=191468 RepID=UPI002627DD79|nr:histidine kinase dimerization/phosphoacceptor domain -containing protein [uncultured Sulfitobacter sp.]